eukprot:sb/3465093/
MSSTDYYGGYQAQAAPPAPTGGGAALPPGMPAPPYGAPPQTAQQPPSYNQYSQQGYGAQYGQQPQQPATQQAGYGNQGGGYGQQQAAQGGYQQAQGGYQQQAQYNNQSYGGATQGGRRVRSATTTTAADPAQGGYGAKNENRDVIENQIFITGLNTKTPPSNDEIKERFGSIGIIKMDKKIRMPRIKIWPDKGCASVTYEDPSAATAAISWFSGKEFGGSTISVELATKSEEWSGGRRGGGRGGGGGSRGGYGGGGDRGGGRDSYGGGGRDRGGRDGGRDSYGGGGRRDRSPRRRSRSPGGRGGGGGGVVRRVIGTVLSVTTTTLPGRFECNRCKAPRPDGGGGGGGGGYGGGGRRDDRYGGGGDRRGAGAVDNKPTYQTSYTSYSKPPSKDHPPGTGESIDAVQMFRQQQQQPVG